MRFSVVSSAADCARLFELQHAHYRILLPIDNMAPLACVMAGLLSETGLSGNFCMMPSSLGTRSPDRWCCTDSDPRWQAGKHTHARACAGPDAGRGAHRRHPLHVPGHHSGAALSRVLLCGLPSALRLRIQLEFGASCCLPVAWRLRLAERLDAVQTGKGQRRDVNLLWSNGAS